MNVERIQKVNDLAVNLMKQGLAGNRDEAIAKAEDIFKQRDTEDYAELRDRMDTEETKPEVKEEKTEPALSQDKIKEIMEKNTSFIIKKFKEFQEKMDSMEREVSFLRNKMSSQNVVKETAKPQQPKATEESSNQQQPENSTSNEEDKHPRSGDYNQNDVSIEKFFYMGQK